MLDWLTIENFLQTELNKAKTVLTFGTIGSLKIEHDIDIVITKQPSITSKEFFKEIHDLSSALDLFLQKKFHKKLIRFSRFDHQEEVLRIGNFKPGDVALHVMCYTSFPQITAHWRPNLPAGLSVKNILRSEYKLLKGNLEDLFSESFNNAKKFDSLLLYMNDCDRINSHYPLGFLLQQQNHLFRYILKNLSMNKKINCSSLEEVRNCFYEVLNCIDKKNDTLM